MSLIPHDLRYAVRALRESPGFTMAAAVVLMVTAFAACYVPALRATKVDPMTALRSE